MIKKLPILLSLAVIFTVSTTLNAQETNTESERAAQAAQGSAIIVRDLSKPLDLSRVEELVSVRTAMPKPGRVKNGRWVIQLDMGDKAMADRIKSRYDSNPLNKEAEIKYEQPYFKVWVGPFDSKVQAERARIELLKDFPKSLVLLPRL